MERATKIIRRAIFTFLKNYHHFMTFTSSILLLLLPFSAASLLSQSLASRDLRLSTPPLAFLLVFGFLSSVFFLVKAKSSILQALMNPLIKPSSLAIPTLHLFLLGFVSALYCLLRSLVPIPKESLGGIFCASFLYYTIDTNVTVVFNLAFVVSQAWNVTSYAAVREALSLRIRDPTALILALASSISSVSIGALFRYRVVGDLNGFRRPLLTVSLEGLLIAYLYSILVVLDTIACFLFVDGYGSELKRSSVPDETELRDTEAAAKVVEQVA